MEQDDRARSDSARASADSNRAVVDSTRAGNDSIRAQHDSERSRASSDDIESKVATVAEARRSQMFRIAAYIVMGLAAALGLWKVKELADDAHDTAAAFAAAERREDAEDLEEEVSRCEDRNLSKEAIIGAIDAALSGGGGTDFTLVPGFEDLDPTIQTFLRNISQPQSDEPSTTEQRLIEHRDSLVIEDCEALRDRRGHQDEKKE